MTLRRERGYATSHGGFTGFECQAGQLLVPGVPHAFVLLMVVMVVGCLTGRGESWGGRSASSRCRKDSNYSVVSVVSVWCVSQSIRETREGRLEHASAPAAFLLFSIQYRLRNYFGGGVKRQLDKATQRLCMLEHVKSRAWLVYE